MNCVMLTYLIDTLELKRFDTIFNKLELRTIEMEFKQNKSKVPNP